MVELAAEPGQAGLPSRAQAEVQYDEAVARLIDLISEHGKWVDPPVRETAEV